MKRIITALCLFIFAAPALANVNIEFRAQAPVVAVNDDVLVGLYLTSNSVVNEAASAADVVFTWDATKLQFQGLDNTGGPSVTFSGLPTQSSLNANLSDGDGFYLLLGQFGNPLIATPQGTFVTTFKFKALAGTAGTTVTAIASGGSNPVQASRVLDGWTPNTNITGSLVPAQVAIQDRKPPVGPR